MTPAEIATLQWDKGAGLLPVIVQHADSGAVLMTAFADRAALERMLATRELTLYSRSRGRLWVKGEQSGHRVEVLEVSCDCDRDALLVRARPSGPVCHTGAPGCFGSASERREPLAFLAQLEALIGARLAAPVPGSYTAQLAAAGLRRIAQKVGEEGVEVALAADGPLPELAAEAADLVYHLLVLLRSRGLGLTQVCAVLAARHESRAAPAG